MGGGDGGDGDAGGGGDEGAGRRRRSGPTAAATEIPGGADGGADGGGSEGGEGCTPPVKRFPQSVQSVPSSHRLLSASCPPSSQMPLPVRG